MKLFSGKQSCAIMCFNTRNLIFKDMFPNKLRENDIGNWFCMFLGCKGRDSYAQLDLAMKHMKLYNAFNFYLKSHHRQMNSHDWDINGHRIHLQTWNEKVQNVLNLDSK